MAIAYGPRIVTDGLVLCHDVGNNRGYTENGVIPRTSESIAGDCTAYGSASYYTLQGDGITIHTSTTGWLAQFPSIVSSTGYYTVAFEYWADSSSLFNIDNDGIMDNTYNTQISATTEKQIFTKTVNVTTTGTSNMYVRRASGSTTSIVMDNYRFYESDSSGNSLVSYDLVGSANGDMTSGTIYSGLNGGNFAFDGVDDRVISDNHSIVSDVRGDFSVGIWLKFGGTSGSHHIPFWISDSNGNGFVYIELGSNYGYLGAATETKARNGYVSGANINDNNWHYIVVTRCTGASVVIYKDGASQTVTTHDMYGGWNTGSGGDMSVGVGMDNGSVYGYSYYGGSYSSLAIYSKVLTATEVLQNYNAYKGRFGL